METAFGQAAARSELKTVGPLAMLVMDGCTELGNSVNEYLLKWTAEPENAVLLSYPGTDKETFLIESECPRFGTGEGKAVIRESVRGYDLYILCDVTNYRKTYRMYGVETYMSPDDYFQDLRRLIAATGSKAYRITVIMPYLYEGRQHRRMARESLDCAIALQELTRMGVDNIITFDAHDPRVQNAIPLHSFDNVQPTYQMLKALFKKEKDIIIDNDHLMVVSPDEGAVNRNIYYASMMGLDLGLFYKRRDYTVVINGRNPIIAHEYLGPSVEGKDVIIADDVISTGESLLDLMRELKQRKARRIFMAATFAMFTGGYEKFDRAYEEGYFDRVISTNLTYLEPELEARPWFIRADLSKYIAYIIATLNHDVSISDLLDPADRIEKLLEKYQSKQREDSPEQLKF